MNFIKYNLKNAEGVIKETVRALRAGGLVVFPSDTVYGLLVDATRPQAVEKLIKFKNRPPGKPISVFVSDFKMLEAQITAKKKTLDLVRELLPGPFTIILNSRHRVDKKLESEKGTLGVRIPDYGLITDLVGRFGSPVTATSANVSGRSPHYSIETLLNDVGVERKKLIDLAVDAGKLPRNKPSTIIDLTTPTARILRKGEVVFENEKTYLSNSPKSTAKVGEYLITKHRTDSKKKPLVFIIEGELGTGKTVMVKGMGAKLGIDNIVSPTYVIYYEYGNFFHFDLYQVEDAEEFEHLGIEAMLKPGNVLVFEWGEKMGDLYELLKKRAKIIYVNMEYLNEHERRIIIKT